MKVILIVVIVLLLLLIGPALFLWSINSLAEISNVDFYIPHGLHSYFVSFILLLLLRGSVAKEKG